MGRGIRHTFYLGLKEFVSLGHDPVLIFLILYSFTLAIYLPAKGAAMDVVNASVAVVDEDHSILSSRIIQALLPPYFLSAGEIQFGQIDRVMDEGKYTFVIVIPPRFQLEVMKGRRPTVEVNVDATAMSQAGRGANYINKIIMQEIAPFWNAANGRRGSSPRSGAGIDLVTRARFNPNMKASWFVAVMQIVNNITVLAIFLTGAAILREREHGTIEHLLVMPLRPAELMFAKIWANGLVIVAAATMSLYLVVRWWLAVPTAGTLGLFLAGMLVYLFSVTSLGILLSTVVRSMPQFALLAFPVFIVMNLLSGGNTPLESMPIALQRIMQFVPSTHFVSFCQAVLFRGADLLVVWPQLAKIALIGSACVFLALTRFRKMLAAVQ
jgi:ABC-2 type transport system permease protein